MKKELIPDLKERTEALDPTRSFIVQAPAGSGKTELLIQRFLLLLGSVKKPEQMLAITYTRKAAGEMHARIMDSLIKAKDRLSPEKESEKKTLELAEKVLKADSKHKWNLLENPGRLKVMTIDSFCASLVRQMPLLSRLGKQPSISEAPEDLYWEAAERTIAMMDDDDKSGESVRLILRHLDNSIIDMEEHLVTMLSKRDQWLRHVRTDGDEERLRSFLEESIKRLIEDVLLKLKNAFPSLQAKNFIKLARFAASNLLAEGMKIRITKLDNLNKMPDSNVNDLEIWQCIADLLLTGSDTWRKPKGISKSIGFPAKTEEKIEFQELLESLIGNENLLEELVDVRKLPNPQYDDEDWEVLRALLHLLPIAEKYLMQVFSKKGLVDFQCVARAALESLGTEENPTDLMLSLDNKIHHILVDEYQDTSRTQLALLKSLTRGWESGEDRSLFIVGDPMQSIYLFREAEVGLFLDAKLNGIGSVELTPLTLKSNFRSTANIVEWVNNAFNWAFPNEEDIFMGSIQYSPFLTVNPMQDGFDVETRIYTARDDKKEATEIAKILNGIDKNETRAILVRARTHLTEIVQALKNEDIDFRAQEIDPLMDRPIIQDLFALLRALMHPYDRTAWLVILRARWCGLSLSDIHNLCFRNKESSVWKLINDDNLITSLSKDGKKRLLSLKEKMQTALSLKGRISPRMLLEGLWIDLCGPACYEGSDSMQDAEGFFNLVDSASTGGEIDSLPGLASRLKDLYAIHSGSGENPVEVMTIHKAKGLEFDHVIIPGIGKEPSHSDKSLLYWMERGEDLLLAPMEKKADENRSVLYDYMSRLKKDKRLLEQTRLFYVASTRARKKLYVFGNVKSLKDDNINVSPKSFISALEPMLNPEMLIEKEYEPDENIPESNDEQISDLNLKRLPSKWERPNVVSLIDIGSQTKIPEIEQPEFFWAKSGIRHLGTVIHRYFHKIAQEGLDSWNKQRVTKEKDRIEAMLLQLGLNKTESEEMSVKGLDLLCKTLEDEKGRWVLTNHQEASAEMPLTGVINGKIINGVIDRTFVDEKGIRWIIDYKTSYHEGGSLKNFLNDEKERYKDQLERYSTLLLSGGEKREIKKGLYYPALSAWIEW
jgi:ATP-dependent exoDNAse (exonuclease V) beta subunit|tara:strand:+ start:2902 stop:6237 length:3336 start_codon:yes stop_codon:yes gene_type:complete